MKNDTKKVARHSAAMPASIPALTKTGLAALAITTDASIWDQAPGETFGGNADILKLEVGQIAGPLTYSGIDAKALELDGEKVDVHTARDGGGKLWRLPLSASFRNQLTESKLASGDTFYFRRLEDAVKKKGKGKGNPMRIFQVKVTARAA